MDKLLAMATFVEIVERGSLTGAADALDKSLPSVVRVLASLEDHLKAKLLNRTTRKISLTDDGRKYLERCKQILQEIDQAELELSAKHSQPTGILKVTSPVQFGQMHIQPLITQFLKEHDQVSAEFMLLDRVVNLVEEGFDVAIRIGELEDSSLIAKHVGHVRRVICASPKLIKKVGKIEHPKLLNSVPCTRHTGLSSKDHWTYIENNKIKSVAINGPLACNNASATIEACVSGLGYGMFLSYQVENYIKANKLKVILEEYEPEPIPVSIIFPHTRLMATRMRAFVDWMVPRLASRI